MSNPDVQALRAFLAHPSPQAIESSPLLVALGARLEAWDAARQQLTMQFAPNDMFRQGAGLIQGGAVAAMLDFALAFAAIAVLPSHQAAVTTTLTTNLIGAGSSPRVVVRGRVLRAGRRSVFAEADMTSDGRLIATASSTLLPVDMGS